MKHSPRSDGSALPASSAMRGEESEHPEYGTHGCCATRLASRRRFIPVGGSGIEVPPFIDLAAGYFLAG